MHEQLRSMRRVGEDNAVLACLTNIEAGCHLPEIGAKYRITCGNEAHRLADQKRPVREWPHSTLIVGGPGLSELLTQICYSLSWCFLYDLPVFTALSLLSLDSKVAASVRRDNASSQDTHWWRSRHSTQPCNRAISNL